MTNSVLRGGACVGGFVCRQTLAGGARETTRARPEHPRLFLGDPREVPSTGCAKASPAPRRWDLVFAPREGRMCVCVCVWEWWGGGGGRVIHQNRVALTLQPVHEILERALIERERLLILFLLVGRDGLGDDRHGLLQRLRGPVHLSARHNAEDRRAGARRFCALSQTHPQNRTKPTLARGLSTCECALFVLLLPLCTQKCTHGNLVALLQANESFLRSLHAKVRIFMCFNGVSSTCFDRLSLSVLRAPYTSTLMECLFDSLVPLLVLYPTSYPLSPSLLIVSCLFLFYVYYGISPSAFQ